MEHILRYNRQYRQGFTLVELSVVLVIIGLIVGGVLLGRDMLRSSEIRSTLAQVEQFKTASTTFKIKYNCLAGDCINASSFLSDAGGVANGNGNSKFDGGGNRWSDPESLYFWQHLGLANLILFRHTPAIIGGAYRPDINYPSAKLGGGFGAWGLQNYTAGGLIGTGKAFPAQYRNNLLLGRNWADTSSRIPLNPILSGYDALAIDIKYDDGKAAYGNIVTWQNTSNYSGGCATTDVADTAEYTPTNTATCSLFFLNIFY